MSSPASHGSSAATGAPESVVLAFNRLMVAIKAHPFAWLVPDEFEPEARLALANGLTADQAKTIRKHLDTAKERSVAKKLLLQVASYADATVMLEWLAAEVKRVLAEAEKTEAEGQSTEGASGGATEGNEGTKKPGAVLHSVKWRDFPMIELKYSGTEHWPHSGSAQAMIKVNHKKVEWLHPGQTVQSLKNIMGAEYYQDIKKGQTALISIADVHGKNESNTMPLVWR